MCTILINTPVFLDPEVFFFLWGGSNIFIPADLALSEPA